MAEADAADLEGLSSQLESVSLAISAAIDDEPFADTSMSELRRWYQTEVFAQETPRWDERRWAFLGQLQSALKNPLTHTVFPYRVDAVEDDSARVTTLGDPASAFGGLLFVGRSRYNDIVVHDETVSRVHCIIVRSGGKVGVFDGWSSYGTVTVRRANGALADSTVDNRRPLLFDDGELFTLRVGKNAIITFTPNTFP